MGILRVYTLFTLSELRTNYEQTRYEVYVLTYSTTGSKTVHRGLSVKQPVLSIGKTSTIGIFLLECILFLDTKTDHNKLCINDLYLLSLYYAYILFIMFLFSTSFC